MIILFFGVFGTPIIGLGESINCPNVAEKIVFGLFLVAPIISLQAGIETHPGVGLVRKSSWKFRILLGTVRNSDKIRYRMLNKVIEL